MAVPVAVLSGFPLLNSLPPDLLAQLASSAQERTVAKREVVLQKGAAAQFLCFLVEGRLQGVDFTVDGREVGIYFIDSGDYFGELAVIDGREQPEFVVSVARSRVIFLPRQVVRPLLFWNPKIAEQVSNRLAQRLRDSTAQRKILGMSNPLQRIAAQLNQLAKASNQAAKPAPVGKTTTVIVNAPTHQELAIMINLSRETVTRAFQLLQAKGLVVRDGSNLVINKPDQMSQVASGEASLSKEATTQDPVD